MANKNCRPGTKESAWPERQMMAVVVEREIRRRASSASGEKKSERERVSKSRRKRVARTTTPASASARSTMQWMPLLALFYSNTIASQIIPIRACYAKHLLPYCTIVPIENTVAIVWFCHHWHASDTVLDIVHHGHSKNRLQ